MLQSVQSERFQLYSPLKAIYHYGLLRDKQTGLPGNLRFVFLLQLVMRETK